MKTKIYVLGALILCAVIAIFILTQEKTEKLTGKDGLIDVETLPGKTIAVNRNDYVNAKPILSTDVSLQSGKVYLYRSDNTFFFVKADEYVVIVTKDFDKTQAAGCEIGNGGEYILIANTAYKGKTTIENGILKFISTRAL